MGIGNAENLQHALQRAILARAAVEDVEGDVGLQIGQHGSDVASDIDRRHPVAQTLERRLGVGDHDSRPVDRLRDENAGRAAGQRLGDEVVTVALDGTAPEAPTDYGIAAGASPIDAAARSTLAALNRRLAQLL